MDSSYQQEQLGDGRVRFTVTPASVPSASGAPFVLAALFVLIVLGTMNRSEGGLGMMIRLALAVLGAPRIHKWTNQWFAKNVDKVRSPGGEFVVSPSAIEAKGAVITREALHRLIVRNGIPDVQEYGVVQTGSMQSAMAAGAQNDRLANRAKATTVSYVLCAEAGGRAVVLGGGMTEVTANGLLTDVSRILRLA